MWKIGSKLNKLQFYFDLPCSSLPDKKNIVANSGQYIHEFSTNGVRCWCSNFFNYSPIILYKLSNLKLVFQVLGGRNYFLANSPYAWEENIIYRLTHNGKKFEGEIAAKQT